jgi:hypothetical protein
VRTVVEDVIGRLTGRSVTVTCILRGEDPIPPSSPTPAPAPGVPTAIPSNGVAPAALRQAVDEDEADRAAQAAIDEQRLQAAKNIFDAEEIVS